MHIQLPEELVLLRHGESVGNAASRASRAGDHSHYTADFRIKDASSWELTAAGESQARKAGEWMSENGLYDFDLNLTSMMTRAIQTHTIATNDEPAVQSHLLNERSWGLLQSIPHAERIVRDLAFRDEDAFAWLPPGGERISHVIQREQTLLSHVPGLYGNPARMRITCHGEVMWAFRFWLESMTPGKYNQLHLDRTPQNMIYNCHLLHYRNLQNGRYQEMRSVCTYNPKRYDSGWQSINQMMQAA